MEGMPVSALVPIQATTQDALLSHTLRSRYLTELERPGPLVLSGEAEEYQRDANDPQHQPYAS